MMRSSYATPPLATPLATPPVGGPETATASLRPVPAMCACRRCAVRVRARALDGLGGWVGGWVVGGGWVVDRRAGAVGREVQAVQGRTLRHQSRPLPGPLLRHADLRHGQPRPCRPDMPTRHADRCDYYDRRPLLRHAETCAPETCRPTTPLELHRSATRSPWARRFQARSCAGSRPAGGRPSSRACIRLGPRGYEAGGSMEEPAPGAGRVWSHPPPSRPPCPARWRAECATTSMEAQESKPSSLLSKATRRSKPWRKTHTHTTVVKEEDGGEG
jgi:hypothetical protein